MPGVDGAVRPTDSALMPEGFRPLTESVPISVSLVVIAESVER